MNLHDGRRVIGKPLLKIVLNPPDASVKTEWLEALRLCSLTMVPEDVLARKVYESSEEESDYDTDSDYETDDSDDEFSLFDKLGRPRDDPAFGRVNGWKPGDTSSEDEYSSEEEDDEEEEEEEEDDDDERYEVVFVTLLSVC